MDPARRYRLLERLAVGGTAEVFHAVREGAGSPIDVVIKRVLPQFARDPRFRALFAEEVALGAALDHPNIVRLLDSGDMDGTCFIALEFVDGKDLARLLDQGRRQGCPPGLAPTLEVGRQVARALQFIHGQTGPDGEPLGIVHRDVSPQNILVSRQGEVKLADFGIARSLLRRERTMDGTLRGKLSYMAPEQTMRGTMDRRVDLFAMGCVLYEMLVGEAPFAGDSEVDTLDRVRHGRIVRPVAELGLPLPLTRVLERLLSFRPEDRFPDAGEVLHALGPLASENGRGADGSLAAWVQALAAGPSDPPAQTLDDAVRALLGVPEEPATAVRESTAVFVARSAPAEGRAPTGSTAASEPAGSASASLAHAPAQSPPPENEIDIKQIVNIKPLIKNKPVLSSRRWIRGVGLAIGLTALILLGILIVVRPWADRRRPEERFAQKTEDGRPTPEAKARAEQRAAASSQRTLHLRSIPEGAAIRIDGQGVGLTPAVLSIPRERVQLELRKTGHRPARRTLDPGTTALTLAIALDPLPSRMAQAFLTLNSLPWSRVYLDGRSLGNTPIVKRPVPAGSHRIELKDAGGRTLRSLRVVLAPGQVRVLSFDLQTRKP